MTYYYQDKYFDIYEILCEYNSKQGHDKCWFYPELFDKLLKVYKIPKVESNLPPKEEFKEYCDIYREKVYSEEERKNHASSSLS